MGTIIKQRISDWEQEIKKAKDFEDPRISKQFEYLKDRLNQIENRYNYTASMTEEQLEDHLKEIETTIKVQVPRNTETKRETTYRYLKGLSDTNDLTIYKQRKRIKKLEKEYEKDISSALTITKEQFAKLTAWDQRNVLDELVQGAAHSKNEAIRQQNHNKHMELIREQAELMGEMITEQLETAKEQQIRKQINHPFQDKDEKDDDEESVKSNETTDSQSPNWKNKLIKGLTSPISFRFPTGWTGGLKQKEQPPHSPSKPSSLRNSVDIAQDELEEILKPSPKTQLEPGQTLSIPPQRPKIQRKILPQRSYSPLSSDLLQKRTYSPIPNEQLEQKKFREHTPTPPPPEQGPSKIREVLLLHDEITQQLESPEFWEDAKIPKMPRYNPKVTTKSNFDGEEYMPIQNTFRGQTYTRYAKPLEKELPLFFDKNNNETVGTEENKGFGLSSSEEDEKRHEKEESDNKSEETDLHIRLNHIHPYIRRKIVPTIIKDKKRDDAIYRAQHVVIPKQHAMSIMIRRQIKDRYISTPEYLAKQEIAIEPGIINDNHVIIVNYLDKNVQISKDQHIGNMEIIEKTPKIFSIKEIEINWKDPKIAVQKHIEEIKEQCEPIVWKQIGDIITKYIDIFRRKEELGTSVNDKVIPKIKLELNKEEKDIPERDKRQQVRKYSKDELKIIKKLLDELKENNIVKQGFSDWGSNVL
ncbi:22889_t:CDS:2, partial [Gigaspora rosea]